MTSCRHSKRGQRRTLNPRLHILKAYLYQVKRMVCGNCEEGARLHTLTVLVHCCISEDYKIEISEGRASVEYLDELDRTMSIKRSTWVTSTLIAPDSHWTNLAIYSGNHHEHGYKTFLAFAIARGLRLYVTYKLTQDPGLLR